MGKNEKQEESWVMAVKNCYKVEKNDQGWMLRDPEGRPFYSLGVDCVTLADVDIKSAGELYRNECGWFPGWADGKLSSIADLGFNTLGAWCHPYYWGNGFSKTIELSLSKLAKKVNTAHEYMRTY